MIFKRSLSAAAFAMFIAGVAVADTASMNPDVTGMGLLQNEWIRAGINLNTGTFGSGGGTSPGLLFDPTGTGTFNPSYDYLTPGSPFDGFAVKVDGTNYSNNNTGSTGITKTGEGLGPNAITWSGAVTDKFQIDMNYSLLAGQPFINGIATINMLTDATTLSFGKFIDPDSQGMPGDSSSTDNVLGYGVIPSTNVAFSEATTSRYALGIYTTDTNVTAGVEGWTQQADGYSGTNYTDADGNPVNYGNSDDTIGISWTWTGVSAGDMLEASYAYIFGPSAFDAAEDAITGGAGGGDTSVTSGWGTLTDVGSATEAAESGASGSGTPEPEAPTVVSSTTVTITSTSEAVSTTLPVLTASITHHESSVAAGVQTIERERTTTVTTPVEVTTTSFDRTTETYSDESVVVTDGDSVSTVAIRNDVETTVTDPGSFVGRADQAQQMLGLNVAHGLGFANGVAGGRTSHSMGNGYSAETTQYGFGHTIATDDGLAITGGLNFADTTMTGTDGSGEMSTTHFGVRVGKALDGRDMTIGIEGNMSTTDLSYSRTVGDFSAAGTTSQSDVWGTFTVEKSTGAIRPWAGYTIGKRSTDAWTETGDIQAVLDNQVSDETYNYATVGLNIEAGLLELGISQAFDAADTTRLSVGVDRQLNDRVAVGGAINRTMAGDNESTFMSAGITVSF